MGFIDEIKISKSEVTKLKGFKSVTIGGGEIIADSCKIYPNYGVLLYRMINEESVLVGTVLGNILRAAHFMVEDTKEHYFLEVGNKNSSQSLYLNIFKPENVKNYSVGDVVIRGDISEIKNNAEMPDTASIFLYFLNSIEDPNLKLQDERKIIETSVGWKILSIEGEIIRVKKGNTVTYVSIQTVSTFEELQADAIKIKGM